MIRNFLLFGLACATSFLHAQDIQWEKSYGGRQADYLFDVQPTADYGFILAGSSLSQNSGNKTETANGDLDYWIWKMDEHGTEDWQKSFGGSGSDLLVSLKNTVDGGFIVAGTSNSPKDKNKTQECFGANDYWIIKLDAKGNQQWQKTYGGTAQDDLVSISPTKDGGYIVGGSSASGKTGNKDSESNGNLDYWILKLDSEGELLWQKSFGGKYADILRAVSQTTDGGYIIGGYSNSPQSKDKSSDAFAQSGDFWILKLDNTGAVEWQKTLGGDGDDQLFSLIQTFDGGYVAAGNSNSGSTGNKSKTNRNGTDFWVLKMDIEGTVQWQETYDFGKLDILSSIVENEDHTLLIAGHAQTEVQGTTKKDKEEINDYIALKISEKGENLWSTSVGSEGEDILKKVIQTRDGSYLLAGTSNPEKPDYIIYTDTKNALAGISNGQNIAIAEKSQDKLDGTINSAAQGINSEIKKGTENIADSAGKLAGQDKDSPFKAGLNMPTGNLLNPVHGSSNANTPDSKNDTCTARGPKPGSKTSRSKTTNYGSKDFWVVKLKDKDIKEKPRTSMEAFPNPAQLFTNVIIGFDFDNGTASLYDFAGRQLQNFKITDRTVPIALGTYPEGIYIVKIATNKGEGSIKIIKGITK